nr:S-methylmethionine--homocysteine S-methyltransferase BHMT2 [Ovis aries]
MRKGVNLGAEHLQTPLSTPPVPGNPEERACKAVASLLKFSEILSGTDDFHKTGDVRPLYPPFLQRGTAFRKNKRNVIFLSILQGLLKRLDSGEVVVGDGSYLLTLEKRGYVKAGLWTPEAVVEHPNAVCQLHMEFLRAGSDVMQTFTFSASEDNMESQWEAVNTAACDLAREVADKGDALVVGGICQTSLYAHHKDEVRIKKLFQLQLEIFARKNVDFLIAQYFEHAVEAVWAVEVLKESGKPVAATVCVGPEGDMPGVTPGECDVKLRKAVPSCTVQGLPWWPLVSEEFCIVSLCEKLASGSSSGAQRARREYWENLWPASGRPLCPSLSKPDA